MYTVVGAMQLSPWRMALENLMFPQLVLKFPAFYVTGESVTKFTRACYLLLHVIRQISHHVLS